MEFYLHYRGQLPSKGTAGDKHRIRKHFHHQLKELWAHGPLHDYATDPAKEDFSNQEGSFVRTVDKHDFIVLVNEQMHMVAELDISMLRPGPSGSIVGNDGDIDNRLKTLFDALRMPLTASEIPRGAPLVEDDQQMFCLLEDDKLIQHVSVRTDRLLERVEHQTEVELLIHVICKVTRATMDNIALGV